MPPLKESKKRRQKRGKGEWSRPNSGTTQSFVLLA